MQHAEKNLEHAVMEHTAQKPVSERHGAKSVTMTETETLCGNLHHSRLNQFLHPQFLKITVGPDIVVTLEEIHFDSLVHKTLQSCKDAQISFRDNIPVLIPEIPYITEKIHGLRILRNRLKKRHKTPLPVCRIRNLQAQMDIRDEICHFPHHANMNIHKAAARQ